MEGGGRQRFFFFLVPGQTGKINLALMTGNNPPLPEAFFGVNRKQEGGKLKYRYRHLHQEGERPGPFYKLLFSVINF